MSDTTQDDLVKRLKNRLKALHDDPREYSPGQIAEASGMALARIEELEAKLAQQDDLVQAANRLAEYLNGDHIYMERVHHLAAAIRKGRE